MRQKRMARKIVATKGCYVLMILTWIICVGLGLYFYDAYLKLSSERVGFNDNHDLYKYAGYSCDVNVDALHKKYFVLLEYMLY